MKILLLCVNILMAISCMIAAINFSDWKQVILFYGVSCILLSLARLELK